MVIGWNAGHERRREVSVLLLSLESIEVNASPSVFYERIESNYMKSRFSLPVQLLSNYQERQDVITKGRD